MVGRMTPAATPSTSTIRKPLVSAVQAGASTARFCGGLGRLLPINHSRTCADKTHLTRDFLSRHATLRWPKSQADDGPNLRRCELGPDEFALSVKNSVVSSRELPRERAEFLVTNRRRPSPRRWQQETPASTSRQGFLDRSKSKIPVLGQEAFPPKTGLSRWHSRGGQPL
jgi:hypothetical protein